MSTRLSVTLKRADGSLLIFVGSNGKKRNDGKSNANRMFRNLKTGKAPYFKEVRGPWISHFYANCAVVADVNRDGLDDLILCDKKGPAKIFIQNSKGFFRKLNLPVNNPNVMEWRNVRVGPVLHRGRLPDIVVAGIGTSGTISIYKGIAKSPFYDFSKPAYVFRTPYATPDVEILVCFAGLIARLLVKKKRSRDLPMFIIVLSLSPFRFVVQDVNGDKNLDIYVVQANEKSGYCAAQSKELVQKYFGGRVNPPGNWMPPIDTAADLLLVGGKYNGKLGFRKIKMDHRRPGCGGIVRRYGSSKRLLLAQGRPIHLGHNLLLEW